MQEVPLIYQSKVALVDDEDYELVMQYNWHLHHDGYANCSIVGLMHRLILNAPIGMDVDHINQNRLDNTRGNIRVVSRGVNVQNRKRKNACGYTGVFKNKEKYSAEIKFNKQRIYLGSFKTPEKAALAYNKAAVRYYGIHAHINKIV